MKIEYLINLAKAVDPLDERRLEVGWRAKIRGKSYGDWVTLCGADVSIRTIMETLKVLKEQAERAEEHLNSGRKSWTLLEGRELFK